MKRNKKLIFLVCYVSYTMIYVARLNLSMASPEMISNGIVNASQVGILGGIFSVVYALGRLINGYASDSKPPLAMICGGLLLAGISNICFGFFPPVAGMYFLWGANAFAQSMLWGAVLSVLTVVFDENRAKKAASYMVTSVATGNIVGILANNLITARLGMRFAFIIPGLLTLICAMSAFCTISKIPVSNKKEAAHISIVNLIKKKEMILPALPAMFHGVMKDNISLWMAVYFSECFGIDLKSMAYFVLFIPVMGFIGRTLYPLFYKICNYKEHIVSLYSFVGCTLMSALLCFDIKSPIIAGLALSVIYAAVSVVNTSLLSIFPMRFKQTGNVSSVSGIMDFCTYLGAGVGSFVYGFTVKNAGFTPMYISWAVISLLSAFIMHRLNSMEAGNKKITVQEQ